MAQTANQSQHVPVIEFCEAFVVVRLFVAPNELGNPFALEVNQSCKFREVPFISHIVKQAF